MNIAALKYLTYMYMAKRKIILIFTVHVWDSDIYSYNVECFTYWNFLSKMQRRKVCKISWKLIAAEECWNHGENPLNVIYF